MELYNKVEYKKYVHCEKKKNYIFHYKNRLKQN